MTVCSCCWFVKSQIFHLFWEHNNNKEGDGEIIWALYKLDFYNITMLFAVVGSKYMYDPRKECKIELEK